jgi:diazepam-binding inhibitor (GABA receptor modulator, acyl-CoA-binding protein)
MSKLIDSTDQEFKLAIDIAPALIKTGKMTDEMMLKMYGLYKQSTEGNCNNVEPYKIQIKEHAKWVEWNKNKNMSQLIAKKAYVKHIIQCSHKCGLM